MRVLTALSVATACLSLSAACGDSAPAPNADRDAGPEDASRQTIDAGAEVAAQPDLGPFVLLAADPPALDLGHVILFCNAPGEMATTTISNHGNVTTAILAVKLHQVKKEWKLESDGCSGRSLGPGASCAVTVRVVNGPGVETASLEIADGAGAISLVNLTAKTVAWKQGLVATPHQAAFGDVREGDTSAETVFSVQFIGCLSSQVGEVRIGGTNADMFEIVREDCSGRILKDSATCEISVVFRPSRTGFARAVLVMNGSVGGTWQGSLTGTGTPKGLVALQPKVDFGAVLICPTESESAKAIPFVNKGPDPVGPLSVSLTSNVFRVSADTCAGATLKEGETCVVTVAFRAFDDRTYNAELTVSGADDVAPVALEARAVIPHGPVLNPTPQDFGSVAVGQPSAPVVFTLDNLGGAPIGDIRADFVGRGAGHFTIVDDACAGKVLGSGRSCQLSVVFKPVEAGPHLATLQIFGTGLCETPSLLTAASVSGSATTPQ